MKYHHLLTLLTAAGILLPAQQATAFTSPLPELAGGISLAPKKNKKVKKGKKKTADKSVKALAKKIFNATDEQKQKAKAFLEQQGNPDLETAVREGNNKIIYAILMTITNEEGEYNKYQSACNLFIALNAADYVELLMESGKIDVSLALCDASREGNAKIVKLLLTSPHIDINNTDNFERRTPLIYAVYQNYLECVKLLLDTPGIDVNKADRYGKTPLHYAPTAECVKLLLAASGIDVNKTGNDGQAPLHDTRKTEIVKQLLAVPGIDVNITDEDGKTPLHYAASGNYPESVEVLLSAPGIDINKADAKGTTALQYAQKYNYTKCIELLKAAGAK